MSITVNSLSVINSPGAVVWSRDAVFFEIAFSISFSGGDSMDASYRLQLEILNDADDSVIYDCSYPLLMALADPTSIPNPATGSIKLYLENILDANLKFQNPTTTDTITAVLMTTNKLKFYLRFKIVAISLTEEEWTTDEGIYTVYKGGIGKMKVTDEMQVNQASIANPAFFPYGVPLLSWVPSGRSMSAKERSWIPFLNKNSYTDLRNYYWVVYSDGSNNFGAPAYGTLPSQGQYKMWHIPMGVEQCSLDPDNKGVAYYTMQILRSSDLDTPICSYTIMVDPRPFYKSLTVYYRNSLGGMDQLRFRGKNEWNSTQAKQEAKRHRTELPDNDGSNNFFTSDMRPGWKLNTGYLGKEHTLALNDLINTSFAAFILAGYYMELRIPSQNITLLDTIENLYNNAIQIESANTYKVMPAELINFLQD